MKRLVNSLAPPTIAWRCPNHPSLDLIMKCAVCSRRFYEHVDKIAALPPLSKRTA